MSEASMDQSVTMEDRSEPMQTRSIPLKEELIISSTFNIENRWKFSNQIIDYTAIECPSPTRLLLDNSNFLRVKIYDTLPGALVHQLLNSLSGPASALRQLEINQWDLIAMNQSVSYTFNELRVLSIDSVLERPLEQVNWMIDFEAPALTHLWLGLRCLRRVSFSQYDRVEHLVLDQGPDLEVRQFVGLRSVVFNGLTLDHSADHVSWSTLMEFAGGSLGNLTEFHCNTHSLWSTSYKPSDKSMLALNTLYQLLKEHLQRFPEEYKTRRFYLQGVQIEDFSLNMLHFEFSESLLQLHCFNFVQNRPIPACPSMFKIEFKGSIPMIASPSRFGGVRIDPKSGEEEERFVRYSQIYPNLQVVVVDNWQEDGEARQPFDSDDVHELLVDCQALTNLELRYSGFQPDFYHSLTTMQSLQMLTAFVLIEEPGWLPAGSKKHFNFDFLDGFRYLRRLITNLATRREMIKLVQRMEVSAVYTFHFSEDGDDSILVVTRLSETRLKSYYKNLFDEGTEELWERFAVHMEIDFQDVAEHYNSDWLYDFSHWLDEPSDSDCRATSPFYSYDWSTGSYTWSSES